MFQLLPVLIPKRIVAGFGGRTDKILKPATEITGIKVSRARYDKEISLPKRVRIDLDKKLIALRSRKSSLWCSVDSLSSSSEPESYSESWWAFSRVTLSPIGNSFEIVHIQGKSSNPFIELVSSYYPTIKFTAEISDTEITFLDTCVY